MHGLNDIYHLWIFAMASVTKIHSREKSNDELENIIEDLNFVDGPWKLKCFRCVKCNKMALKHNIANCGDIFCKKCYQHLLDNPCPACQRIILEKHEDSQFEMELLQLKVECENRKHGCEEILILANYMKHKKECLFLSDATGVSLYQLNELRTVFHSEVDTKFSEIQKIVTAYQDLNIQNELNELKLRISTLERVMLKNAGKACDQRSDTVISNTMESIADVTQNMSLSANWEDDGLDDRVAIFNWDIPKIEQKIRHGFDRINYQHNQFQNPVQRMNNRLRQTNSRGNALRFGHSHLVTHALKTAEEENHDEVLLKNGKSGLEIKVSLAIADSADMVIFINLFNNAYLGDYFCKCILLDQSKITEKKHVIVMDQPIDNVPVRFFPLKLLTKTKGRSVDQFEADNETYVRNDIISVRIVLHPMSYIHKSVTSKNGVLVWQIANYAMARQDMVNGVIPCLYSRSFYTSEYGFMVQARAFLNGFAQNSWEYVAIQLDFVPGMFEHVLPKTFAYEIRVSVLEQTSFPKRKNIFQNYEYSPTNTLPKKGIVASQRRCVFLELLYANFAENPHYFKNDSVWFKIEVDIN